MSQTPKAKMSGATHAAIQYVPLASKDSTLMVVTFKVRLG